MSKYFLCMCMEYMWRSQNNLKCHCSTGIVNHFLGDKSCCWDSGLNEPKSPRSFLCLPPQFWDYNHMPPCYAFYVGAGDGTWVLTLTHSKDFIDIIVSPAPAMFSWSLWEYVNFVDGQPRAQGKHLCLIPRWLSWLVDFVGFVVVFVVIVCRLNTS